MDKNARTPLSQAEFDKKVEFEFCYVERWEYLPKREAWQTALERVSAEYVVNNRAS